VCGGVERNGLYWLDVLASPQVRLGLRLVFALSSTRFSTWSSIVLLFYLLVWLEAVNSYTVSSGNRLAVNDCKSSRCSAIWYTNVPDCGFSSTSDRTTKLVRRTKSLTHNSWNRSASPAKLFPLTCAPNKAASQSTGDVGVRVLVFEEQSCKLCSEMYSYAGTSRKQRSQEGDDELLSCAVVLLILLPASRCALGSCSWSRAG